MHRYLCTGVHQLLILVGIVKHCFNYLIDLHLLSLTEGSTLLVSCLPVLDKVCQQLPFNQGTIRSSLMRH